jgi:DNA repair protein RecN
VLSELRITNLGVIAEADLELHPGFTVVTGETGAGKTMVVSSLQLLTGQRADSSQVRNTADEDISEARVEGRFYVDGLPDELAHQTSELLAGCGAETDDDESIIALRTIRSDGRSRAHLGGRSVPAGILAEFSRPLLTIHGQHDQLRLLSSAQQREALDQYGGDEISELYTVYRKLWEQWKVCSRELRERQSQGRERAREVAQLRESVAEINQVNLSSGEDRQLQEEIRRLMDVDELRDIASRAYFLVSGDVSFLSGDGLSSLPDHSSPAAISSLGESRDVLHGSSDAVLEESAEQLDEVLSILEELSSGLHSYLEALDADPVVLEEKLARQASIKNIIRKYGVDADDVLRWKNDAEKRIAELDTSETTLDQLQKEVDRLAGELHEAAHTLTLARKKYARTLQKLVTSVLHTLAMDKATFTIDISPLDDAATSGSTEHFSEYGADSVTFLLAANNGSTPQPISKAASGGELSRVMLALEVVLAQKDYGRTLIFDEVDSGIGGSTALEIGRCLSRLSRTHQVFAVTHLPQVAAFADSHLTVTKDNSTQVAVTTVTHLDDDERILELSRMLAGIGDTETGKAHAKELWETAKKLKTAD